MAIVDVAVACDEDDNFGRAEQEKVTKYIPIREAILERAEKEGWGNQVEVDVIPLVAAYHLPEKRIECRI